MSFIPKYGRLQRVSPLPAPPPLADLESDEFAPVLTAAYGQSKAAIPDDWRDLPWNALRALAAGLARDDEPVKTKADCVARIEAELALRAAS